MEPEKTLGKFTANQLLYIEYLGAGQIDEDGKKISKEGFANMLNIAASTLYEWQKLPGFYDAVVEAADRLILRRYPKLIRAMEIKAMKGDVAAFKVMTNQAGKLKAERQEIKHEMSIDNALDWAWKRYPRMEVS